MTHPLTHAAAGTKHRPGSPAPGTRSLMTLGMCRDPLHRPLSSRGSGSRHVPRPAEICRAPASASLRLSKSRTVKALVNSAACQPTIHVGNGELSLGYG